MKIGLIIGISQGHIGEKIRLGIGERLDVCWNIWCGIVVCVVHSLVIILWCSLRFSVCCIRNLLYWSRIVLNWGGFTISCGPILAL